MKRRITLLSAMFAAGLAAGTAHSQCIDEGAWRSLPSLPVATVYSCSVVVDGRLYVFGNRNYSPDNNRAFCFDPQSGVWTELPNMPTGRGMAAAAAVDGVIHVFGGNDSISNHWLTTHESFDTRTNTWTSNLPPLPHIARGLLSAVAVGHKIYVMGGLNSYDVPTYNYNCIWDCDSNLWAPDGTVLPTPRAEHAAAALDGKIYVFGGRYRIVHGQERSIVDVDVYDPQTNSWSNGGSMPIPRVEHAAVQNCGKFYVIGGIELFPSGQQGAALRSVLEFDPNLDCWSTVTPLPTPLCYQSAALLGGRAVVVGGARDAGGHPAIADVQSGTPKRMIGDLDGDGGVGLTDLANLLANFGRIWTNN